MRRGRRGGGRHKNGVRDTGRKPLARRSIAQLRNKPDPVIPVYTGPSARQLAGGARREWSWGAECCTAEWEARGEASCVCEGMGLSDGRGGKKEGRL